MIVSQTELANLLFPNLPHTHTELEAKYPRRATPGEVTRFAPSPTGFLHIGGVFSAFIGERVAHQSSGVFCYRTEDTDAKREINGAVELMVRGLKSFGIQIDEGPIGPNESDIGNYGPYTQSLRKDIYAAFAKKLIAEGKAYPCFMTEEELAEMREQQTALGQPTWVYGSFSVWRNADFEMIEQALTAGKPFVVRFKSQGKITGKITLHDQIRGRLEMGENFTDTVILKKDGIPTYHFAHVVDDYLMGTTLVTRGDEWIPSYPLHAEMTAALGFPPLRYGHIAPLMKLDGGNKRKLSKRKDPEANVEYFFEQGYPTEAIIDYMFSVMDSGYEAWRRENPSEDYRAFPISLERLPHSGALFDMMKLDFFANEYMTRLSTEELLSRGKEWASRFDATLATLIETHPDIAFRALDIERHTEKDPRRFTKFSDIRTQIAPFFDETYRELRTSAPAFPESIDHETQQAFIADYLSKYDAAMDRDAWFEQLKDIAHAHGFARTGEEWKTGNYKGRVGDIAMMLRILLCGTSRTPDLCLSMRALGTETVTRRLLG